MRPFPALPKRSAILALAALAVACGDGVTDPGALGDSAEAEAVLRSADALPALPRLIERAGTPPDLHSRTALFRAADLWAAGVASDGAAAAATRRLAVRYATPVLAAQMPPEAWEDVDRDLRAWISTARSMLSHISVAGLEARLEMAERHLDRAASAASAEARARSLLMAGAELVETTPRFVARSLSARALAAVEQARADDALDPERLARAERLKDWAAQAVEQGDYLVAIQRAYYALQLVEARE